MNCHECRDAQLDAGFVLGSQMSLEEARSVGDRHGEIKGPHAAHAACSWSRSRDDAVKCRQDRRLAVTRLAGVQRRREAGIHGCVEHRCGSLTHWHRELQIGLRNPANSVSGC